MAAKNHWGGRAKELTDQYKVPLRPDSVHLGAIAHCAVSDVLECKAAGQTQLSEALLDYMVPRLREQSIDERTQGRSDYNGKEMMMTVSEAAHVGWWLKTGTFDRELGDRAIHWREEMERLWGGRRTGPNLLASMLLAVETGRSEAAEHLYEEHAKPVLSLPPKDMRFTRNPRSVLYLHLKYGKQLSSQRLCQQALSGFLKVSTRWEKGLFPVPYVSITDAARLVHACEWLQGGNLTVDAVVDLVR